MKKATTDKEFLKRVKEIAPEVLDAEVDFDEKIIRALPTQRINETKSKIFSHQSVKRKKSRK